MDRRGSDLNIHIVEIRVLAERLLALADTANMEDELAHSAMNPGDGFEQSYILSNVAREVYRARRMREKHLPARFFGEPAWDILLDLFINYCDGRTVSVTSSCIAAATPSSTALRWLSTLEDENLIVRRAHPEDQRSSLIELTKAGRQKVASHLRWLAANKTAPSERVFNSAEGHGGRWSG